MLITINIFKILLLLIMHLMCIYISILFSCSVSLLATLNSSINKVYVVIVVVVNLLYITFKMR